MLSLIGIIALIMLVICIVFCCIWCNNREDCSGWGFGIGASAFVFVGMLIPIICGAVILGTSKKIDAQIEMYTEENAKIELAITETVEKYLEHEYKIFDSLQGEDIQTLLVVYPEINSNELVKNQIEIFITNNDKIKQLKNDKINLSTWKFLIYFGN